MMTCFNIPWRFRQLKDENKYYERKEDLKRDWEPPGSFALDVRARKV